MISEVLPRLHRILKVFYKIACAGTFGEAVIATVWYWVIFSSLWLRNRSVTRELSSISLLLISNSVTLYFHMPHDATDAQIFLSPLKRYSTKRTNCTKLSDTTHEIQFM